MRHSLSIVGCQLISEEEKTLQALVAKEVVGPNIVIFLILTFLQDLHGRDRCGSGSSTHSTEATLTKLHTSPLFEGK